MSVDRGLSAQAPSPALAERRRRLCLLGVVFGAAFLSVGLRLLDMVDWSHGGALPHGVLTAPANAAADVETGVRAEITDRNGELLATNMRVPTFYVNAAAINNPEVAAHRLAAVLSGVDEQRLVERLRLKRRSAPIKYQITPEEEKAVLELGLPGTTFEPALMRVYPKRNLASHLVGYAGMDGKGLAGIERGMDDRLRLDSRPLALSMDLRVQQIVRDELFSAYVRFRAKGANAMVLDAASGEVLAMVSLPDFDPNQPPNVNPVTQSKDDKDRLFNRNTTGTYELGSLFKIFTTAMGIDSGVVSVTDQIDATQPLRIGRETIHDDHAKRRPLSLPECFMYSSNICMAKIAKLGGGDVFSGFLRRLHFDEKPDIELPQAELGAPQWPKKWRDITVATVSFGHGIAISPFQYISAVAGLVRDQQPWMRPTLLLGGDAAAQTMPTPVATRTAQDLRWMMWLTVEKGTGTLAKQPAYLLGGKTGTADKPKEGGRGYQHGAVLASFAGVFPIEHPRYIVLVMLDEPHGDDRTHGLHYAAWTAAPVVRDIVDRIGPVLELQPSDPMAKNDFLGRMVVTRTGEGHGEERVAALASAR